MISIITPVKDDLEATATLSPPLVEPSSLVEIILITSRPCSEALLKLIAGHGQVVTVEEDGYVAKMAAGAAVANGEVLLFMEAPNRLPAQALASISQNLQLLPQMIGGNLHLKFDPPSWLGRRLARILKHWRYRGHYFRGSGLFIRKTVYETLGGFTPQTFLPDYEFVQRMERYGPTVYLPEVIYLPLPSWRVILVWLLGPSLLPSRLTRPILKWIYPDEERQAKSASSNLVISSD